MFEGADAYRLISAHERLTGEVDTHAEINLDADLEAFAKTDKKLDVYSSLAGTVIRAENRDVFEAITERLKKAALAPLTQWYHQKKCDFCQIAMGRLIDKGCEWGIDRVCDLSAGTACGAMGVPFADTICAKACSVCFQVVLVEKCNEWLKLLMTKYPNNPLNFCKAQQFCGADDVVVPCKCCSSSYCSGAKLCR